MHKNCNFLVICKFLTYNVRSCHSVNMFVPKHRPIKKSDTDCFNYFFDKYDKILVLTGAGISTESGIPDYRSEGVGLYARTNHKPMEYQEFIRSSHSRKRYWARNFLGWPRMESLKPNISHLALAKLGNKVRIVTQNVDGLHTAAGSKDLVELHGSSHRVVCLKCGDMTSRTSLQQRFLDYNREIKVKIGAIRPDGDVDIHEEEVANFKVVNCEKCDGILKPDIVFFGDNVPSSRVQKVANWVEDSDSLLVIGSSLTVYSSYRIILQAHSLQKYIFIINIGPTRGDKYANLKLNVQSSDLLSQIKNCT